MINNKFEVARRKYKPEKIRYLLIAETPPKSDSERFFYFEKVMTQDSLFLETMKSLYPRDTMNLEALDIRNKKVEFLRKFQKDGYYLIDSLDEPFEKKYSSAQKIDLIQKGQKNLLSSINSIANPTTKIILISATVHKANYTFLEQNGVNVINEHLIEFPGFRWHKVYREKLRNVL